MQLPDTILLLTIMTDNSVSISVTSAIVYGVSGGFFLMLIIFLVMMSCDYDCSRYNLIRLQRLTRGVLISISSGKVRTSPKFWGPSPSSLLTITTPISRNQTFIQIMPVKLCSLFSVRKRNEKSLFGISKNLKQHCKIFCIRTDSKKTLTIKLLIR